MADATHLSGFHRRSAEQVDRFQSKLGGDVQGLDNIELALTGFILRNELLSCSEAIGEFLLAPPVRDPGGT